MLGLNETIDQSAMAYNWHWHGNVLRKEDGRASDKSLRLKVKEEEKG